MDPNKVKELKEPHFIAGLNDYIKDCLKPMYHFYCLDDILYDPQFQNNILMYVALHDNRLTFLMYGTTE